MMAYRVYGEGRYPLWSGKSSVMTSLPSVSVLPDTPRSNVPGVAIYFYALSTIRTELSLIPYFQNQSDPSSSSQSALVRLSSQGNLVAGAIARTSVGFVLNPITVLKARYEVSPDIPGLDSPDPGRGDAERVHRTGWC